MLIINIVKKLKLSNISKLIMMVYMQEGLLLIKKMEYVHLMMKLKRINIPEILENAGNR